MGVVSVMGTDKVITGQRANCRRRRCLNPRSHGEYQRFVNPDITYNDAIAPARALGYGERLCRRLIQCESAGAAASVTTRKQIGSDVSANFITHVGEPMRRRMMNISRGINQLEGNFDNDSYRTSPRP